MACKVTRDEDGKFLAVTCGSAWGIGVYMYGDDPIYGFPPDGMNPHDFTPDRECCTPQEIAAWEESKRAWDASKLDDRGDPS